MVLNIKLAVTKCATVPLLEEMLVVNDVDVLKHSSACTPLKAQERKVWEGRQRFVRWTVYRIDTENGAKHGRQTPERFSDGLRGSSRC